MLKHGENGKGIRSRWYPRTLCQRIERIQVVRHKISFIEGDGIAVIREHGHRKTAAFFIDPPYTAAGKRAGTRLYTHSQLDHEELFKESAKIKGSLLMTYDNADEVIAMAAANGFSTRTVRMKNTHHATMKELLIGRDLTWVNS